MNRFYQTKFTAVFGITFFVLAGFAARAQKPVWKCVKNADSIQVYSRKSDSANYKIIKVTTRVKTSLSSLVYLLTDPPNHKNWVCMNKKAEVLKKKDTFHWILYSQTDAPRPVSDRDIITKVRLFQDSLNNAVYITGTALPDYLEKDPDHVRIPYAESKWSFVPEKNGWVSVTFTLELDVGGKIPRWLANLTAAKGPYETMRKLRSEIKKKKYKTARLAYIKEPKSF
jgi:hypothetical protein